MPRKNDASGPQQGNSPAGEVSNTRPRLRLGEESAFGLDALARTLDEAALNMSMLALQGTGEAARGSSPLAAADVVRRLADQITNQMKGLEVALSEVVNAGRR